MKIFVFYSFKGGVGRTALMLHLGVHWSDRGRVVALVDMDLQAPGLSFHPWLTPPDDRNEYHKYGVSDLLATFYTTRDTENKTFNFFPSSRSLREMKPPGSGNKWGNNGRLLVLPAGDVTIPQMLIVQNAETIPIPPVKAMPDEPEEQVAMRAFAEKFIQDFRNFRLEDHPRQAGIDYLLIDCRTGYPELAELTMGYLADRLILVSGLNQQNLRGLGITLNKLRPQRVPRGRYNTDLLVAFSPVPAHLFEDPVGRKVLEEGVKILERHRIPGEATEADEQLPPCFTLPYSPHLVISDTPIPRDRVLRKLHPYWEAVEQIADTLDAKKTLQESTQEIHRQVLSMMEPPASETGREIMLEEGQIAVALSTSLKNRSSIIWQMPKWHWPFRGDQKKIRTWLQKYPIDKNWHEQRELLLDGLCVSMQSLDQKRLILESWKTLSHFQVDSLVHLFQKEQLEFLSTVSNDEPEKMTRLFQQQKEWAEFMLGKKNGEEAFLLRPLKEPLLFESWQQSSYYWFMLAEALEKTKLFLPEATAARKQAIDIAVANPWESMAIFHEDRFINRDIANQMLDRILAQPIPNDIDLCTSLCVNILNIESIELSVKIINIVDKLLLLAPNSELTHIIHGSLCYQIEKYSASEKAFEPDQLECFRDFVEGRTNGAGDPRELHIFCKNAGFEWPDNATKPVNIEIQVEESGSS